jgi:FKBP12-rapamycin complex-associated protein
VEADPLRLIVLRPSSIQTSIPIGGSANEEYYQNVVVSSLLRILSDSSQTESHHHVVECIMTIFKTQGLKAVIFLPQVRRYDDICNTILT